MTNPQAITDLFGDYRAEWPSSHFANYFVRPAYFAKLESPRPCFLFGGRGTGKTTALRSLRFDTAQTRASRENAAATNVESLKYLGIYLRMDKNQVRAFEGPEFDDRGWGKLFTHYFNLLACREFCLLLSWVSHVRPDLGQPSVHQLSQVPLALSVPVEGEDVIAIRDALDLAIIKLELFINNPSKSEQPILSIAERSVRLFASIISGLPWAVDKPIFCCVDEYENLLKLQQSIINTYIKHSTSPLSYKVGVRSNGLHSHYTIDKEDQLKTPDDFIEVDIPEEGFEPFARSVAELRLKHAASNGLDVPSTLDEFLPGLSLDEEAKLLGVDRIADKVRRVFAGAGHSEIRKFLETQSPARIALLSYWRDAHSEEELEALANHWIANPDTWAVRWGNFSYSLLFWLSRGRKGAQIKKYYSGSTTFLSMASGNIRYFMELLDRSIAAEESMSTAGAGGSPFVVSPRAQTLAAKTVGQKRLEQLEGVSENGVRLKRLVLGIGRIFFERTRTAGLAPEQNFFTLSGDPLDVEKMVVLLADGVAHLAFEAFARNKRTSGAEPSDDEYRIHPIFCAFFEISHRKKRRVAFEAAGLLELIDNPAAGISSLLKNKQSEDEDLPEQLAMFAPFFRSTGKN